MHMEFVIKSTGKRSASSRLSRFGFALLYPENLRGLLKLCVQGPIPCKKRSFKLRSASHQARSDGIAGNARQKYRHDVTVGTAFVGRGERPCRANR